MTKPARRAVGAVLLTGAGVLACHGGSSSRRNTAADDPGPPRAEHAQAAFSHALPSLNGSELEATIVEVSYAPGGSSPPHTHPCPVIGYVIDGALKTQTQGEPAATYSAGQSFYEPPNSVHVVSANASSERPVRFLAYFVCDHRAPLVAPPPDAAPQ
jgi:quercetin dioxygenase-like cupin family protein